MFDIVHNTRWPECGGSYIPPAIQFDINYIHQDCLALKRKKATTMTQVLSKMLETMLLFANCAEVGNSRNTPSW